MTSSISAHGTACPLQVTCAHTMACAHRFVGGVREEFGPTPHVMYVACPTSDAKELRSALVEAALALQSSCQELNVAPGVTIGSADPPGSRAAQTAETLSAAAANDLGAHVEARSHYIHVTGSAESMPATDAGPRLRLLTLQVRSLCIRCSLTAPCRIASYDSCPAKQVVSEAMLMDITGQAACFLAQSTHSRQPPCME